MHTCAAKMMTVINPTQECKVYKLAVGGFAKLWESKTAFRPITDIMKAKRCKIMCRSFIGFLGEFL